MRQKSKPSVLIMRWIARLWSLFVITLALVVVISPDPHATGEPLKAREIIMLSVWGIAILGLVIAWFKELVGSLITIITMLVREPLYFILYKEWIINFLIFWALVIPPAVLFLLAWVLDKKDRAQTSPSSL